MEESKDTIRLNTVRRVDPHAIKIIDSAARTALYRYEEEVGEEWTKVDVEGTFMIYMREAPPYNMITIINKLNKTNFTEVLSPACDIQVKPPFLLFRNSNSAIYGIWFSEQDDVHRISAVVREKITPEASKPEKEPSGNSTDTGPGAENTGNADIMSMLTKAHGEYTNRQNDPAIVESGHSQINQEVSAIKTSPNQPQNSTDAVASFMAKVGGGLGGPAAQASQPPPPGPGSPAASNTTLQKLFLDAAALGGQACVGGGGGGPTTTPVAIPGASLHQPIASSLPMGMSAGAPMSLQELEGKLKEDLTVNSKEDDNLLIFRGGPNPSFHGKGCEPVSLLTPQVFTTPQLNNGAVEGAFVHSFEPVGTSTKSDPSILPLSSTLSDTRTEVNLPSGVTPLTQEQLVQTFTILLKQQDFVQQLHAAYIQALNQSFKGCL